VRDLKIVVKHMKPECVKSNEAMSNGLTNWYAEMQTKGRIAAGEKQMNQFADKGLSLEQLHTIDADMKHR